MSSKRTAALAALVLGLATAGAEAETYVVFDPPGSSGQQVTPTGINDSGEVTGFYYTSHDISGFVRSAGGALTVFQGVENLLPAGINAVGTVVGYTSFSHGFVRSSDGTLTPYNVPNSDSTDLYAINAAGDMAGTYWSAARGGGSFIQPARDSLVTLPGQFAILALNDRGDAAGYVAVRNALNALHGAVRSREGDQATFSAPHVGRRLDVGAAGQSDRNDHTVALAINASGTATGYAYDVCPQGRGACASYHLVRSFVRSADGTITSFRMPDAPAGDTGRTGPFAQAINASGTVTGYYNRATDANAVYHGFLRDASGRISTFDVPGMTTTSPAAINDSGVVTGYCVDANGMQHGFVRWP